ncbi:MAG: hypothetical protein WCJ01_01830 [Ignavibacteria bacterium]
MPLKKPSGVPKLSKARKKNSEAAKKAIPQKKEDKNEYLLKALFYYDETMHRQYYLLRLETIAEFTSFAYEISVDAQIEKKDINITIMGLQTKMNYLPNIEPAKADVPYENLVGDYTVNVIKQDGCINSAVFNFNIYSKNIKLIKKFIPLKKNNRRFCEFEVAEQEFSFQPE